MIYYFIPKYSEASWGIGMLYQHVDMLQRNGIEATVLHEKKGRRLRWMKSELALTSKDLGSFEPQPNDVLVVPELWADNETLRRVNCRRVVFVQGSFLMLHQLRSAIDYQTLGFEHAIVTQPHIQSIVEKHFDVQASVIPAFVAPQFFLDRQAILNQTRTRQVLTYPKAGYQALGLPDYDIVIRFLKRKLANHSQSRNEWSLVELKNKTHQEVAELMQASAFFVNVNSLEGFNVTVPEAMASGCISICYDAIGGRDYLRDKYNAYVFNNHEAYALLDRLFDLINRYEHMQQELEQMRLNAYGTACEYTMAHTEKYLLAFFHSFLG